MNEELEKRFFEEFVIPFNKAGFRFQRKIKKFYNYHIEIYEAFLSENLSHRKYTFYEKKICGKWFFIVLPSDSYYSYLDLLFSKL